MKKLIRSLFVILTVLVSVSLSQAQTITIGSFDGERSPVPFTGSSPVGGYFKLRAFLLDPSNFGPTGSVHCPVTIAPPTPTITPEYLADKTVFFTSRFRGELSASEADAIREFVARGGSVIVDA